jgi:hypothetical protein
MEATQADLNVGVGTEIGRPALRPRLAGEGHHLHKKQVPRARGRQEAWNMPTACRFCSQFLHGRTFSVRVYPLDYSGLDSKV